MTADNNAANNDNAHAGTHLMRCVISFLFISFGSVINILIYNQIG